MKSKNFTDKQLTEITSGFEFSFDFNNTCPACGHQSLNVESKEAGQFIIHCTAAMCQKTVKLQIRLDVV